MRKFSSNKICSFKLPFIIKKLLKQYKYAIILKVYAITIIYILFEN
jgi:hypothetical protein